MLPTIVFGDGGAFIKEHPPVLLYPRVVICGEQGNDPCPSDACGPAHAAAHERA